MAQLRWYYFRSKSGSTIASKGRSEAEAKEDAADRLNCGEDELVCTEHEPYYGGRKLW